MSEHREYSQEHAAAEIFQALINAKLGRKASLQEVKLHLGLALLDVSQKPILKRPKGFLVDEPVISVEDLKGLSLNVPNPFKDLQYIPTERLLVRGSEHRGLAQRDSEIMHPLMAFPNHLMFKDLFIQYRWHYPLEIVKGGRPTFGMGIHRLRGVLRELESEVTIFTVSGVGVILK